MRKMKDSGIPWIGEIPADWSIVKIKAGVHKVGSGKTPSGGATSYADEGVLFLRSQNVYDTGLELSNPAYITPEVDEEMKGTRVFPNDVLLNITGGSIGRCCIFPESLETANVNQHVSIIRVDERVFLPEFMHYYWISPLGSIAISLYQTGGNREGMSAEAIKNTPIILMPLEEQKRICKLLDAKCAEIDAVLDKTRTSIEEYKKLKQAIITQAVTKGIRGDRPMKESGIEWIGAIPENWDVRRIKSIGTYRNGLTYAPEDQTDESGTLVLRSSNVQNGRLDFSNNVFVSCEIPAQLMVQKGDILICSRNGSRELIGKSAIIDSDICASFGAFMMVFRCECPRYMYYLLNSNIFSVYLNTFLTTTINQLTGKNFGNMNIVYCPDTVEQDEIVSFLDKRCLELDELIIKKKRLINALESYKKSLIYEYVTGKKEVSNAT